MSTEALLRVEGVSRYYGDFCAVRHLDLAVSRGEVVGLLGVNGAGKTTVLQMLSGNLAPSSGRIEIAGHDLARAPRRAKQALGYLPDQPPLYRDMTVTEFLRYVARLHGVARGRVDSSVAQVISRCGLSDVAPRLIGNLSKGFRQRVGIAQAIVHDPPLVILDEPTVGLDVVQMQAIRRLVRELAAQHGVILSTHMLAEVEAVCDRVEILHAGQVVYRHALSQSSAQAAGSLARARLLTPPAIDRILTLLGVIEAHYTAPGWLQVQVSHYEPFAEALTAAATREGWRLVEIAPLQRSLEQVFLTAIRDDVAAEDRTA